VAVGVSYYKTGIYVGVIGGEILGAASPATIAIIDPKVTDVSFNIERAEMPEINLCLHWSGIADIMLLYLQWRI
jgi:hypothetical protein